MDYTRLDESVQEVTTNLSIAAPLCSVILGSGWGDVAEPFDIEGSIDYADIPCLGATGVVGHAGQLVCIRSHEQQVLLFLGRRHWYEGDGWTPIAFPIYLSARLGVSTALLTNAAGGINPEFAPGDLMILNDHINAIGSNPLVGPHHPIWGTRFADQSHVYAPALRDHLRAAAADHGFTPREGTYLATSGPTYETPAEIRAFRTMGADAVGMSTVPEAMLANAAGIQVAGLSCITNLAAGASEDQTLDHSEVIDTSNASMPAMQAMIGGFIDTVCRNA